MSVLLAAALCVLVAAAAGGYALVGSRAADAVNLVSASGASSRDVTVYACLASGKLTRVSLAAAPKCAAKSAGVHWAGQSGPAGASSRDVTVYACLASGKLTRVSLAAAPKCAAKSAGVHWAGQSGPAGTSSPVPSASSSPSPSSSTTTSGPPPAPSPTTSNPATSPSPSPSSTSPSPSSTSPSPYACVISAPLGNCYFSAYAGITGADSLPWAGNDMWNPISGATTTMYANNPGDFYVVANMPAGNTAVVAYPDTAVNFTRAVSAYHSITSSFTETMNPVTGTNAEASYDIWFSNGVPVHTWNLCQGATTSWWVIADGNFSSGSVDILAMVNWLISHGHLGQGATFGTLSYGWEISSTGGQDETFRVSDFTISAS